jgi:dTDP-4-dehydrorhamnose 3,5-epimerase
MSGEIFDVAVDIRKDSPTYGQHVSVVLRGDEPAWFWIPGGFAHGFCVTSKDGADVVYKVDAVWNAKSEGCIIWSDLELKIKWPISEINVSNKDKIGLSFSSSKSNLTK